jgi:transcriptional regulator with XRE-family HTH domain
MEKIPSSRNLVEARIAERLKRRRTAIGLTLDQLAERSGVSRAMISKIERMETSPTASLLGRLTAALGLTMPALFAEERRQGPLMRRGDQPVWRDPETGYLRRDLTPAVEWPVGLVEIELPPTASIVFDVPIRPVVHQIVHVLQGEVLIVIDGERHELGEGDSLAMTIDGLRRFENRTSKPARYLLALASSTGQPLER